MIKRLKNHLLLENGAVFHYLQLVQESVVLTGHGRIKLYNWKGLLQVRLTYKKVVLSGQTIYLTVHNSYGGYYHWLLESLPKLLEARREVSEFTLLLPACYTDSFYADTLRLLGISSVARLQPQTMYQAPTLVLPYVSEGMGDYALNALREVKAALLDAIGATKPTGSPKRLYVSRRKAARRKVVNEAEVEQLMTCYGFEVVCFEDYTFEAQLQLCASADTLVSIHGAGLSNILFLPEKSTVIEFRKFDNGENYFYTQLASTLQHSYHLLYCAAENEQQSVQDADLRVDIATLEAVLTRQPPAGGH
jgi:capsular polysaccharide biosynthesis protein